VGWSVAFDHEIVSRLADELVALLLILCFCLFVPDAVAYLADHFLFDSVIKPSRYSNCWRWKIRTVKQYFIFHISALSAFAAMMESRIVSSEALGLCWTLFTCRSKFIQPGTLATMSCRRMTWWSDSDQRNIETCVTQIPSSSTPHKILYWLQSLIWYKTLLRFIISPRNTIPDRPAGYRQIYTWCLIRGLQMSGHDSEREIPWCEVWKCQQR
jgi:hypothetical protein